MSARAIVRSLSIAAIAVALSQALGADQPETVMITLRARPGAERALAEAIARHHDTARRLHLLREDAPHVTLRASEEGDKAYFVDIFTWRDAEAPDNAPPAIQAIWKEMNELVEARGGRPALEIVPMTPVTVTPGK